jgi:hypothetical protein
MAQPTPEDANGVKMPEGDAGENGHVVAASGKRKRDSDNGDRPEDGDDEMDVDSKVEQHDDIDDDDDDDEDDGKTPEPEVDTTKSKEVIKAFVEVLRRYDCICREPRLRCFSFPFSSLSHSLSRYHGISSFASPILVPAPSVLEELESMQADH